MVKLVRLKTNNKDGIFDCRFDDNIKLKPNAEIALKNISFHQNFPVINIDAVNGEISATSVSADVDNSNFSTQFIEPNSYDHSSFATLLQEIENALNKTLSCSNQLAKGKPDVLQLFSCYRVYLRGDRVVIAYRLCFCDSFTKTYLSSKPIGGEIQNVKKNGRNTLSLTAATTATNSTKYRQVALNKICLSKGSGIFGTQIYKSVNAAVGQEEYNGFILGLSIENKRSLIGEDNTNDPRINDDDIDAEIPNGARSFEIDFRQLNQNYRVRSGGFIKDGTAPTLTDSGVAPSNGAEPADATTASKNDIVQFKIDTNNNNEKIIQASVVKETTSGSGVFHEVVLFTHTLTDEDLGFNTENDYLNRNNSGLSDFTEHVFTPYIILRGNENNIELCNTTFVPDTTVDAKFLVVGGLNRDRNSGYFVTQDRNLLNDAVLVNTDQRAFLNGNNGFGDAREREMFNIQRVSSIQINDGLLLALGGIKVSGANETSNEIKDFNLFDSGVRGSGTAEEVRVGNIGVDFEMARISDFIAREFYMIEALNLNLDSFNSSNDNFTKENNGERKNILATLNAVSQATEEGYMAHEPNEAHYIDIKNNNDLNIRELKFRIVDENFDRITINGNANMTILLKD